MAFKLDQFGRTTYFESKKDFILWRGREREIFFSFVQKLIMRQRYRWVILKDDEMRTWW
jgi:hypothetical protein